MKKVLGLCLSAVLLMACSSGEEKLFRKAQILTDKGQLEKAVQTYSSIIKKNPHHYAALVSRGLLYEQLKVKNADQAKKNKKLAERDYLQAISLSGNHAEIFNNLAALYIDQGQYSEAILHLNQALLLQPDYLMALLNRAVAYSQQGNIFKALADFSAVERLDYKSTLLYLNRGLAYLNHGYYASAVEEYSRLIELEPENPRAYLERGRAFVKMGYFQNAMDDFQKSIALREDYALPYYYAAELLFSKGDTEQGIAYAERAKMFASNYAPIYDMLGDMLALESPVDATQHYLAARRLDPNNAPRYQGKIRLMTTEEGRKRVVANRFLNIGKK